MSKGNKGFGALLTEGLDDEPETDTPPVGEGIMSSRSQTLARLAAGKVVADRTEFVDPERCRPWRLHNRDLDHLDEASCRDLIDTFLSAKKQRIPAIVRRVRNDPDFDFEIIVGVRRWWTVRWLREHHHTEFDYLVTVQNLTDEEAFRVGDIENRGRKDITDYERAQEYARALDEFYEGSQSRMAEHINVSRSWLSRMLDVARLPAEIVAAFADRHDVTVRIARDLKPLAGDGRSFAAMAAEAERIVMERDEDGRSVTAAETVKRLVAATQAPRSRRNPRPSSTELRSAANRPMLSITKGEGRAAGLTIMILPRSGANKREILDAIDRVLTEQLPH